MDWTKVKCGSLGVAVLVVGAAAGLGTLPEEEVTRLPAYVVTAAHFPALAEEVPATIRVLGREEWEARPLVSVPELLEGVAGLRFQSYSGNPLEAQVNLRGFSENGNQRVLLLVDGMRLNRPDMGGFNWSQVPLASIESVELLKGGHSVIYGNHAVAGVIKIETRKGGPAQTQLDATVGENGQEYASLWTGGRAGPAGYGFGLEHARTDGWRANSGSEARAAVAAINLGAGSRWSADLRLHLGDSELALPGPINSVDFPENPRAAYDLIEKADTYQSAGLRLSYEDADGRALEWVNGVNRRTFESDWATWGSHSDVELLSWNTQPRVRLTRGRLEWTLGADLLRDELDATQYPDATRADASGAGTLRRDATAGYALATLTLAPEVKAALGGRLEHTRLQGRYAQRPWGDPDGPLQPAFDEAVSDTDHSLTVGINWKPAPALRAWARLERVYRYPGTDEVASYQGYLLPVPFNTALRPESGRSWEAGLGWAANGLTAELAGFRLDLDDEIAFDPVTFLNANLSGTRRQGIDLALSWKIATVTLRADATLQEAEFTDGPWAGNRLYLVPRRLFALAAEWEPLASLGTGLTVRHTGRQFIGNDLANDQPQMPSYTVAGWHLHLRLSEALRLRAAIDNLFDKRYAAVVFKNDWAPGSDWYPAPGRTARIGVQVVF